MSSPSSHNANATIRTVSLQPSSQSSQNSQTSQCMRVEFDLHRDLLFYVAVLLIPMLILTMPLIVLLLVSPGYRLKIPAMLVVILLYCLLLHFVCSLSPGGTSRVPLIAIYPLSLMIISVTSACVSITSIRQQRGVAVDRLPLQRSVSSCCQRIPTPPPPVELKELQAIAKSRCVCDSPDGDNDACFPTEYTYDNERKIQIKNSNGSCHVRNHNKSFCSLFECEASDRKVVRNSRASSCRADSDWGIIPTIRTLECSIEEKRQAVSAVEKDNSCRTSSTLERNLDMALFIVVVMLLISYVIIIIIVSF